MDDDGSRWMSVVVQAEAVQIALNDLERAIENLNDLRNFTVLDAIDQCSQQLDRLKEST